MDFCGTGSGSYGWPLGRLFVGCCFEKFENRLQMFGHGFCGGVGIVGGDGFDDRVVMFLDHAVKVRTGHAIETDFGQGGLQDVMEHFHDVVINDRSVARPIIICRRWSSSARYFAARRGSCA